MSDNQELLKRFALHPGLLPRSDMDEAESEEETCPVFGYLRGTKERAVMLELRFRNGNRCAFPYSWIGMAEFNPSHGITLRFVGDMTYVVTITGSNLNSPSQGRITLFQQGLLRQRVLWLREMDRSEFLTNEDGRTTIETIVIERQAERH